MSVFRFESEMRDSVADWLRSRGCAVAIEFFIYHMVDALGVIFGDRPSERRIPPIQELYAVELKLFDIAGVIQQAKSNRHAVDWSFAAMPRSVVNRMREDTRRKFRLNGVGLLSVGETVEIVIDAERGSRSALKRIHRNSWRRMRKEYLATEAGTPT